MIHDLVLFFAAASFTTIFLYTVVLVFLMIGIYTDSVGSNTSFKWWALLGLYALYFLDNFGSITVHSTISTIFSKDTLITTLKYLGIGMVYSLIEFRFTIKDASEKFARIARSYQAVYDKDRTAQSPRFVDRYSTLNIAFIEAKYDAIDKVATTKIISRKLTDYLTAWAILWPFYAINMLFGRFIAEFFSIFAEYIKKVFGGHITKIFNAKLESFKDE